MDETHVEHLVSLIKNQINRLVQTHSAAVQQVDQTTRSCDQQVNAASQTLGLCHDARATNNKRHFQVAALGVGCQVFSNLLGQFAGWRKDQAAHGFRVWLYACLQQRMDHRQTKGRRFSGTGLGKAHHIAAVHGVRDGLGLDRGRFNDPLFFEYINQSGRKAQHVKIHEWISYLMRTSGPRISMAHSKMP